MDADVIVIGHGLAGLVATAELADAGRRVLLLDQENAANLGGQAFWSFGGLLLVDSPEQRRMGIKDSAELLWQDWEGTAGWDRLSDADGSPGPDHWGREWARAYVDFASGEKRAWLHEQGMRWFPVVGWAERGDGRAGGHGNSVPRFHVTWGTGPGVVEPFERRVRAHRAPAASSTARGTGSTSSSSPTEPSRASGSRPRRRRRRAGQALQPGRRRRVRADRAGRRRHLRRHRRQPRPRPRQLARAPRHRRRRR